MSWRSFWLVSGLLLVGIACRPEKKRPLVIVLGIDGMDPVFVDRHMEALPNLQALMRAGEFKRLQTTMPPQSPVAWSTFSTGLDPSEHGIFDFVYRDPSTGKPFSAMGETEAPAHRLLLGECALPIGLPHVKTFRHGIFFWKLLGDAGVPVKILRMPVNYPPLEAKAVALSGMGVPDMRGSFGTFTFFTDAGGARKRAVAGGEIVPVELEKDRTQLMVSGPGDPYRRDNAPMQVGLRVDVDPFENVARFQVQQQTFILKAGEWSQWIPIQFAHANGIFRIYAKGFRPTFEVYVSPVNFDPKKTDAEISIPTRESARIASQIGRFYTQGMAEDTAAYRQGVFNREEYLRQSRMVSDEQTRILKEELEGFQQGFLFLHYSGVDQNSHMLWGRFDDELLETYRRADEMVGWVRKNDPQATLIVMSDHGFSTFERSVNLNAWLLGQGLSKKAYSLGLNAIYLRLVGRETDGTVAHAEAAETLRAVGDRLLQLHDPKDGRPVVARVYSPHPDFTGDIELIPDLIVGFERGYRSSWEGDLGDASGPVLADNSDAWIGDHCIAPEFVPGVLIGNRKSHFADPSLKDLTVSILGLYGIQPAAGMNGKVIY